MSRHGRDDEVPPDESAEWHGEEETRSSAIEHCEEEGIGNFFIDWLEEIAQNAGYRNSEEMEEHIDLLQRNERIKQESLVELKGIDTSTTKADRHRQEAIDSVAEMFIPGMLHTAKPILPKRNIVKAESIYLSNGKRRKRPDEIQVKESGGFKFKYMTPRIKALLLAQHKRPPSIENDDHYTREAKGEGRKDDEDPR